LIQIGWKCNDGVYRLYAFHIFVQIHLPSFLIGQR
jgi:hypothetical protein